MDIQEANNKNQCKTENKVKYPESVLRVSEYLRKARENTPPNTEMVECEDNLEDKTYSMRTPVNIDTTPPSSSSSGSSTPTGSPCSSVSCSGHSCGSLFAKCAEHGRWPLLQTFTNRESPLSQQTFSNRYSQERNYNYLDDDIPLRNKDTAKLQLFKSHVHVCCKRQPNKTILQNSEERSPGILRRDKKVIKNKVKFANGSPAIRETERIELEETEVKPCNDVIIRRHNSLPDRRIAPDENTLCELNEIYNTSILTSNNERVTLFEKEDKLTVKHRKTKRQRSKSEDKLNVNKWANDFNENKVKKNLISSVTCNWSDKYHKNCANGCLVMKSSSKDKEVNSEKDVYIFRSKDGCFLGALASDSQKNCKKNYNSRSNYCDHYESERLRCVVSKLTNQAKESEHKIDFLETEILLLRRELKKRDQESIKLQREVHKLRSVLQETSILKQEGDLLSSLQDSHEMPGQSQHIVAIPNPNKKQGVSGESSNHGRNHDQIEIQRFEKDFRSKQLIKDAIMENDFLKNLDTSQVREIVESVYPMEFSKGDYVLREGEAGSHLYVSAEGELEVIKDHKVLGRMGPGKAFGELAILYNCRRTASIKVVSDAKVWVLDRTVFQKIMMKTGLQRLQENLNFLRSVPLLQSLSNEVLAKIADVLEVDFYPSGEHIIRQGASGDTFFIISSGSVKVTQQKPGRQEEEEIRILSKGDYFGEQALLKEDWRTANVIALSPGVECLTLDRDSFIQLIGDLSELQEKDYGDQVRGFSRPSSSSSLCDKQEYDYIRLEDLDIVGTLGVGGFGRVELVQYSKNKSVTFALKCLKKQHIVETKQQEHVYSERNIMMACSSPFICRLYKTFRDSKYVYMLQEALLGGEVWTILRERGYFDDYTTKFVTGCVVEAFEYLHARGIIYRDLKPENLLLDNMGYAKLVDFGFSKRLGFSSKTWTFCGTPEYLAPEIILNKGHDRAVDYWSLGVLMHELLTGIPPFTAPDPMRTYNIILKGIDMIDFPRYITRAAQSLIKRLCRDAPSERLGYQRGGIMDIKKHRWFQGFDWAGLKQRVLTAPISPLVRSPTDTSNFDFYSKETNVPPDEFSNWDAEF